MLISHKERQSEENLDDLFELDIRIFHPLSESEGSLIPTQHDATCVTSAPPGSPECLFTIAVCLVPPPTITC